MLPFLFNFCNNYLSSLYEYPFVIISLDAYDRKFPICILGLGETMSKFLKCSLLVLTLMGLAFSSVAHANAPAHDSAECSVCIYQPNTDLQTTSAEQTIPESLDLAEQTLVWATPTITEQLFSPYYGRAPPYTA